jgi:hypothetical protein
MLLTCRHFDIDCCGSCHWDDDEDYPMDDRNVPEELIKKYELEKDSYAYICCRVHVELSNIELSTELWEKAILAKLKEEADEI